jgi:hypothetical protein
MMGESSPTVFGKKTSSTDEFQYSAVHPPGQKSSMSIGQE